MVEDPDPIEISSDEMELPPPPKVLKTVEKPTLRDRSIRKRCVECQAYLSDCSCGKMLASEVKAAWPCIRQTTHNKKFTSQQRVKEDLRDFLAGKINEKELDGIELEDWLAWLVMWGSARGKSTYANGEKGPCPQTAMTFFQYFMSVLRDKFSFEIAKKFPEIRLFPRQWMRTIARDKLYSRTQAQYFSREDVRNYMSLFEDYRTLGSETQNYYAGMAAVIGTVYENTKFKRF